MTMTLKTDLPNLGVPLLVDAGRDLPAKAGNPGDSWYVICNFRAGGREIGFEWHQMVLTLPGGQRLSTTEFLLMDATQGIWLPYTVDEPVTDEIGAATEHCRVISSFGGLEGDAGRLTLRLEAAEGAVDLVLCPRGQTLYNGTIGVLPILDTTFQYAWPNMDVSGKIRLKGEELEVSGTTAWFDRQWSASASAEKKHAAAGQVSSFAWLWLGMTLDPEEKSAISLWDITSRDGKRHAFATILDEQGVQANHAAEVSYDRIWKSDRTGNSYPRQLSVVIPTAHLDLSFEALLDQPEFDRGGKEDSPTGCQSPCSVRGRYRTHDISGTVIVEMIGDVCGELVEP
jgi:predicted secreted hydrolase